MLLNEQVDVKMNKKSKKLHGKKNYLFEFQRKLFC